MEDTLIHELAAAYALDALTAEEERTYQDHLARCERCQEDVAAFSETTAALAFAVPSVGPPSNLRDRIMRAARAEQTQVVPLRPRWAYPALLAGAVAASAAIGLGVWATTMHSRIDSLAGAMHALPLKGANGSVVVAGDGEATLVVTGLVQAPNGKTYEVWVMRGTTSQPAGLFSGKSQTTMLLLSRPVPAGAHVDVTLERAGGATRPTSRPLMTSTPA